MHCYPLLTLSQGSCKFGEKCRFAHVEKSEQACPEPTTQSTVAIAESATTGIVLAEPLAAVNAIPAADSLNSDTVQLSQPESSST